MTIALTVGVVCGLLIGAIILCFYPDTRDR